MGSTRQRIGLVSAWASRLGGGVFEAVVAQAHSISELGYEPVVFALEDQHCATDQERFGAIEVQVFPVAGPRQFGFAPGMVRALLGARLDLLHLHGIWMYPSRAGSVWAARTARPYVISPHGMLDPWILARGRTKKALARLGYERESWRRAVRFHALTEDEADDIRRAARRAECVVIPNAVPPAAAAPGPAGCSVIYLGRIHPKKNLHALVEAWGLAGEAVAAAGATLTIAGWGDDADVRALESRVEPHPTIRFIGPVYGEVKDRLLAEARWVCLPSHSEGLPMTVLEAWTAARPTLMSRHCHLPEGFNAGAALESGTDPAAIAAALREALAMPESDWRKRASAAKALADSRFSPSAVAAAWRETYADLIGR